MISNKKNQYQCGFSSLYFKIMLIFLVFGSLFTCLFFSYQYLAEKNSIENEFSLSHKYSEDSLIHAIQLADQSFSLYDNAYNPVLKIALQRFQEIYHQSGITPADMDLVSVKNELSTYFEQPIDLYIINASGVIVASTFEAEVGMDFSSIPQFMKKLTNIRLGNSTEYDAIVTGLKLGEERKYGYIPTNDHEFILEIGINLQKFFREQEISKYPRFAHWYGQTRQDVSSVWIYDLTFLQASDIKTAIPGFSDYTYEFQEIEGRKNNLLKVYRGHDSIELAGPQKNQVTRYLYIPQINSSSVSSGLFDKVAEIVYSTGQMQIKINEALSRNIFHALLVIAVLVLIAFVIARYISRPVYQIIEDIEIIANGDYEHPIRRTKGFEFKRLQASIQKMVEKLKADIISIRQKTYELDAELQNRLRVEESLKAANHKLSLLGIITRHDLLNQITVVSSGLELIDDDIEKNEQNIKLFTMMKNSLFSIREIIQFTKMYERMGVDEPIWHNISLLIKETMVNFYSQPCEVIDNTNNLEVFADPMFNRVIYNLIENSFRHGGKISKIKFESFFEDDVALIIYSDNGSGILLENKEKIFSIGYGKNSGLGLYFIRDVLSFTEIEIRETGTEGMGACFELRIPHGKWRIRNVNP